MTDLSEKTIDELLSRKAHCDRRLCGPNARYRGLLTKWARDVNEERAAIRAELERRERATVEGKTSYEQHDGIYYTD
jgi:hypothetical protein